jgi:O-antigen ligase
VLSAAVGIVAVASSLAFGTSFGVTRLADLGGFPAATGFAFEHNLFGSSCAVAAVVLLGLWRAGAEVVPARHALFGFWIASIATAASFTRGAWIAYATGVFVVFVVEQRSVSGRSFAHLATQGLGILLLLLATGFVVGGLAQAGREAITMLQVQGQRALEFETGTGGRRTREWQAALIEAQAAPVFGLGANSYGQRHVERTLHGNIPSFLGNWAIRTLHDGGVIGFVMLLVFIGGTVWPSHWLRYASGSAAASAGALAAGGVTIAVAYLAADGLLLVWPWVFLGLVWVWRAAAREEDQGASPLRISATS